MVCIGVCGEGAERVIRQLCKKYIDADIRAERYTGADSYLEYMNFLKEAEEKGCGAVIGEAPLKNELIKYDILIIVSSDFEGLNKIRNIRENGYLIINADDCGNFPYLLTDNINIITCGVKSTSSVTFSGITENRNGRECIQCCIQREIKTLSGRKIEPQEFSVNVIGLKYPISEVLAITAAAIAADIEETITSDCLI